MRSFSIAVDRPIPHWSTSQATQDKWPSSAHWPARSNSTNRSNHSASAASSRRRPSTSDFPSSLTGMRYIVSERCDIYVAHLLENGDDYCPVWRVALADLFRAPGRAERRALAAARRRRHDLLERVA